MAKIKNTENLNMYYLLKDAANLYAAGVTKPDKRVQVKMPGFIVDALDKQYPDVDRSSVITNAIIELLLRKLRTTNPELEDWVNDDQQDMDRMWEYLEERDAQ